MLTEAEKATNYDTMRHIERVRNLLNVFAVELLRRGELHDQSKLESPEVEALTANTARLAGLTYGSAEYKANFDSPDMRAYVEHHYAHNRHHPQWFRQDEEWRPVDGYEGLYEVSSYGEVRSLDRTVERSGPTGNLFKKGQSLTAYYTPKGYLRLALSRGGRSKNHLVHRLVAAAFLPNPDDKPEVNHKDGNKDNNRVGNLEWVTECENLCHAYDTGLKLPNIKYVVTCEELGLTTFGCVEMAAECHKLGYTRVSDSGVWQSINRGGKHCDLEFTGTRFERWMASPVNDMTLVDVLEMLVDWKAASERHTDGNIRKSIEVNTERFGLSPQLATILENTVRFFDLD